MASAATSCAFCSAEQDNLLKCSRCKSIFYCNKDCQRSDWKVHKMICKPVNEMPNVLSNAFKMDIARVADFICSELKSHEFCLMDNFLPQNTAKRILREVRALDDSGLFKDGQLSGGFTSSEDSEKYSEKKIRGDRLTWVEGSEAGVECVKELMTHLDNLVLQCNGSNHNLGGYDIQGRTKAMIACYPGQQTGYIRHVDNPDGDGRCLTVIFYLNEGWTEADGGKLRIYKKTHHYDVEPLFNRLLLFWSDMRNPHEVLPSNAVRYAITMWYFDKEERNSAKQKQKDMLMGEFGCEVAIRDVEKKKSERDQAQLKLDEESERLVTTMMSENELDAIAELIKGQANPKEQLALHGISPSILDALLRVLEKRF